MRVPDDVVSTAANVTLRFADWKAGQVQPATYELPIVECSEDDAAPPEVD